MLFLLEDLCLMQEERSSTTFLVYVRICFVFVFVFFFDAMISVPSNEFEVVVLVGKRDIELVNRLSKRQESTTSPHCHTHLLPYESVETH
jgi:hypothetical protein